MIFPQIRNPSSLRKVQEAWIGGIKEKRPIMLEEEAKVWSTREKEETELEELLFNLELKVQVSVGEERRSKTWPLAFSRRPALSAKLTCLTRDGREAEQRKILERFIKDQNSRAYAHMLRRNQQLLMAWNLSNCTFSCALLYQSASCWKEL